MKGTWLLFVALATAAIGGGAYYYFTKVEVKVEVPVSPSVAPARSPRDHVGSLEKARHPKFPNEGSSSQQGDSK